MQVDKYETEGPLIKIFKEFQQKEEFRIQQELERERLQELELQKLRDSELVQKQQMDETTVVKPEYIYINNYTNSKYTPKQLFGYLLVIAAIFSIGSICYIIYLFVESLHLDIRQKASEKSAGITINRNYNENTRVCKSI